jgi:hypothetical protein
MELTGPGHTTWLSPTVNTAMAKHESAGVLLEQAGRRHSSGVFGSW